MNVDWVGPEAAWRVRTVRLAALRTDPAAFSSTFDGEVSRPIGFWEERLRRAQTALATWDGEDVGLLTLAGTPGGAALFGLWVAPEIRGRGVGMALVRSALERAGGPVELEVRHTGPARAFYQRLGFDVVGEGDGTVRMRFTRR